jgi:hypothetical protein
LQTVLLLAAAAAARQTIKMDATAVLAAALIETLVLLVLRERASLGKVLLEAPLPLILQAAAVVALLLLGLMPAPQLLRERAETA